MGSDRARLSYNAKKQYRAVVDQQGRATLEADRNEAQQIASEELREETLDIVGATGTPDDGYRVIQPTRPVGAPFDFVVQGGTMYVGGIRAFLNHPIKPIEPPSKFRLNYRTQFDWLDAVGDRTWVENPTAEREFVYLYLQEQEISAVEDAELLEQALGGPDTTQRLRLIQHIVRVGIEGDTCEEGLETAIATWEKAGLTFERDTMRLQSATRLQVSFTDEKPAPTPCDPDSRGGYLEADNQLIRVQIAAYDETTEKYTLVWGFDNASFLYQIKVLNEKTLQLLNPLPVDEFHKPRSDQWVEVLRSAAQVSSTAFAAAHTGYVKGINNYDIDTRTIELDATTPLTSIEMERLEKSPRTFARIWEEAIEIADSPQPVTVKLKQTGLQITLQSVGNLPFHVGDYWMIAVRPGAPTAPMQIYPDRYLQNVQPPEGPRLWACPLAVLLWQQTIERRRRSLQVVDCRQPFDNLVELSKRRGTGCCTVLVRPEEVREGQTLQMILDRYKNQGAVTICLMPGVYRLQQPLRLDASHSGLTLQGCQAGVILQAAQGNEKAFLDGLVVLVSADRVTLKRLQFHIPIVPFVASGGRLAGFTDQQMQQLRENLGGDTGVCIGARPVQCGQLAIEDCQFRFLPSVTLQNLPIILRELELINIFGVGIFAASDCLGLTVHRNQFLVGQNGDLSPNTRQQINLLGYVLVPTIVSAPPPPQDTILGAATAPASTARVVLSRLDDASFQDNELSGLILATLIDAETGSVQITGNRVWECYVGFWMLSLRSLASSAEALTELQREFANAWTQIIQLLQRLLGTSDTGNQFALLILWIILFTLLNPVVLASILVAILYPLPTQFDQTNSIAVTTERTIAFNRTAESVRSIRDRVSTVFTAESLHAPGINITNLQNAVPLAVNTVSNPASLEILQVVGDRIFSIFAALDLTHPPLRLSLDFSHNRVDAQVTGGSPSGNALMIWDFDQQTNSSVTMSDNHLSNRALQPLLIPTALILLVDRVTVTGNLITNEWELQPIPQLQSTQQNTLWPVSLILLPGGPLPPTPDEVKQGATPYNPLVAITGNVFKGVPLLPPRAVAPPLDNWFVLNTASL